MSGKVHVIKLNQYGTDNIGARVLGVNIKNEVISLIKATPQLEIIFDFEGIKYISTGFAKELFGELYKELGEKFVKQIKIKVDKDNNVIKEIIKKGMSTIKI